ncbi:MAG: hypothetical protein U0984_08620 [Prosthecobacter sp.]|nr:hypothetical protein [Prosthecobacter sp.]
MPRWVGMRIARLSPTGSVETIVMENLCPLSAEIEAHRVASRQPGVFFAVVPDDADIVLCIAHRMGSRKPA